MPLRSKINGRARVARWGFGAGGAPAVWRKRRPGLGLMFGRGAKVVRGAQGGEGGLLPLRPVALCGATEPGRCERRTGA